MLSWLIEKAAGAVRETYNAAEATVGYTIDTVTDIPDAITRGWNSGLIEHQDNNPTVGHTDTVVAAEPKKFGLNR